MNSGEIKCKPVWISYRSFSPKWSFKPAWDFHVKKLPKAKWISADSLDIAINAHVRLKLIASVISLRSFWQKKKFILADKISYKHYPKWNAYACPSKYWKKYWVKWNSAKMKFRVNRACFHSSLKSQAGMSSFHLLCECTLNELFFFA